MSGWNATRLQDIRAWSASSPTKEPLNQVGIMRPPPYTGHGMFSGSKGPRPVDAEAIPQGRHPLFVAVGNYPGMAAAEGAL